MEDEAGNAGHRGRGRPPSLSAKQQELAYNLCISESMPVRKIAAILGVSHMAVWRALERRMVSEWKLQKHMEEKAAGQR